jgi:hypothetical protein
MKRSWLAVALVTSLLVGAACGKDAEQQAREDVDREMAARGEKKPSDTPDPPKAAAPKKVEKEKPPADPEPTTAAEIDDARKKAMRENRAKDVIHYCQLSKFDEKTDPQALLGCTVAACRESDTDHAKEWSKPLQKAFRDQAVKTCAAFKVTL